MDSLLASAFTIGLLGSLHCIGMCGGLVSAITMSREKLWWPGLIAYQGARVSSYVLLGVLIAAIGLSLHGGEMQNIQVWLSYFAAAVMVLFALNLGGWLPDPLSRFTATIMRISGLGRWSKQAHQQESLVPWLMVGWLNGLLPCGLVYAALALSLTANSLEQGALIMFAFGLGTIPSMLATPYLMRKLTPQLRGILLKVAAIALIILAIFTATRHLLHGDHSHDNGNAHASHVMEMATPSPQQQEMESHHHAPEVQAPQPPDASQHHHH